MTDASTPDPADLSGTADERRRQLAETATAPSAAWLTRQLHAALTAWAAAETTVDIEEEARSDF